MTYSVYQHWDPLKVCIVGRSYAPEFYSFITNSKARMVMERIAQETEEDYQKLIKLLESFGVKILRPDCFSSVEEAYDRVGNTGKIITPPMTPRDDMAMIGENLFLRCHPEFKYMYDLIKGTDWPQWLDNIKDLPDWVLEEMGPNVLDMHDLYTYDRRYAYKNIVEYLKQKHVNIIDSEISSANTARIGKDLYHGSTEHHRQPVFDLPELEKYRIHKIPIDGHSDGVYCPVVPGLIISLKEVETYEKTFPGWEVVYLPDQSWDQVRPFLNLKRKNKGKWWVPGEELNDDFTDFVESWLGHWVGYVEETVFDVNMLVIDRHNVVCNNYNKQVFDAFERFGITPHIVNFRHRYFWDGGLHCITSDIHREGTMKDYFPERG